MDTVHDPYVSDEQAGPRVTPDFALAVEQAEAFYGLPPESRAA